MNNLNKRSFFRIVYPSGENPVFKFGKRQYLVLDISEGGCSFLTDSATDVMPNDRIEGTIQFRSRGGEVISGQVVRVDGRKISLRFLKTPGMPLPRIMSEQRYLIQKHKMSS